jgi:hypothetical protein
MLRDGAFAGRDRDGCATLLRRRPEIVEAFRNAIQKVPCEWYRAYDLADGQVRAAAPQRIEAIKRRQPIAEPRVGDGERPIDPDGTGLLEHRFPLPAGGLLILTGVETGRAEEAARSRLTAGVNYPSDAAVGLALGKQVAALVIARGKSDGTDAKWTGSVPEGAGRWTGTNPILPTAGTWRPWVLSSPGEFRPPPPIPYDSPEKAAELAELKSFPRTPVTNNEALFWEAAVGGLGHINTGTSSSAKRRWNTGSTATRHAPRVLSHSRLSHSMMRPSPAGKRNTPIGDPPLPTRSGGQADICDAQPSELSSRTCLLVDRSQQSARLPVPTRRCDP